MQGMCRPDDTKVRDVQFIVKAIAWMAGLALAVGVGGAVHPMGDSWAVFRVEIAVVFALSVIWTDWSKQIRWGLAGLVFGLLGWHVLQSRAAALVQSDLTLFQQNLLFDRADGGAPILAMIQKTAPDFIVFQEVSDRNRPILKQLRGDYPFQQDCPLASNLGEAVLSRHPMVAGTGFCSRRDGLAAMQVRTPDGPVWIGSVHLSWPWPKGQAAQVDQILPDMARLTGPAVLAGDFNAVAWSHTVARIGAATGTTRRGPFRATFHLPVFGLPVGLDHVLTSPDFSAMVQRTPKAGGDHHGSLTHLEWRNDG